MTYESFDPSAIEMPSPHHFLLPSSQAATSLTCKQPKHSKERRKTIDMSVAAIITRRQDITNFFLQIKAHHLAASR
jgi:hypothetical protein